MFNVKYNDLTIQKLRELSILEVAEKLDFKLIGEGNEGRRALCPYHDDNHPSLHFSKKKGIFKCFVCGATGDIFKLVMDERNCTFPEACEWLVKKFNIFVIPSGSGETRKHSTLESRNRGNMEIRKQGTTETRKQESVNPSIPKSFIPLNSELVDKTLSANSEFCKAVVSAVYLSESRIRHAAARYRLGATKDGGVIFWEIDDQQRVHTGKIMYYQPDCHRDKHHTPTWVHSLMKSQLPANYELQHCLFGLHLLMEDVRCKKEDVKSPNPSFRSSGSPLPTICIVESEKTAVIMSEIVKDSIWLSCGGLQMFKPELLAPLVNHKVVVFPDTDETGEAFNQWLTVLQQAQRQYTFKYPLRISNLLELHATSEQKARKIDIVDYLFEGGG